jgi:hypothetical protein
MRLLSDTAECQINISPWLHFLQKGNDTELISVGSCISTSKMSLLRDTLTLFLPFYSIQDCDFILRVQDITNKVYIIRINGNYRI